MPSKRRRQIRLRLAGVERDVGRRIEAALLDLSIAVDGDGEPSACLVVCDEPGSDCESLVVASRRDGLRVIVARRSHEPEELSWNALKAGASDVVVENDARRLALALLERLRRWEGIDSTLRSPLVRETLIGSDPLWMQSLEQAVETALYSSAPTLLTGETGTGKELVCRLIHTLDRRRKKGDLIVLDCTTVVPALSGSEFFGHEKGAFTGAVSSRDGAFALADGGTLFLDEIGELRLELQAELLRVLQEGTYKRVGGSRWQNTAFRLICATHRDLRAMVADGSFRSDLYHRLAANRVTLPSLEDRRGDVLTLAESFLGAHLETEEPPPFDRTMRRYLDRRDYPGNVRDLQQLVARIAVRYCGEGPITIGTIPPDERPTSAVPPDGGPDPATGSDQSNDLLHVAIRQGWSLSLIKDRVRDHVLEIVYEQERTAKSRGAVRRTAERLGVSERLVQQWKARSETGGTNLARTQV